MDTGNSHRRTVAATVFAAVFATGIAAGIAAGAATVPSVSIESFDRAVRDARVGALASSQVETFETLATGEVFGGLATGVGVFDTLGGTGSGGTVSGTAGNTGKGVYLRDRKVHGRKNTTADGRNFVDSNDTRGLSWTISGLGMFDRVFFTMADVADSGATLSLLADGVQVGPALSRKRNGAVDMVMLSFATAVDTLTLQLRNSKTNDGFSIDDAGIGMSRIAAQTPAAIPLPPAAALLLGGVAAIALLGRRRRA